LVAPAPAVVDLATHRAATPDRGARRHHRSSSGSAGLGAGGDHFDLETDEGRLFPDRMLEFLERRLEEGRRHRDE
jgi:hypothetical protein